MRRCYCLLSRSQLKAKFSDSLDENRLIFVVLSGRIQRLERDFGVVIRLQQESTYAPVTFGHSRGGERIRGGSSGKRKKEKIEEKEEKEK